jgi:hypothetical protein
MSANNVFRAYNNATTTEAGHILLRGYTHFCFVEMANKHNARDRKRKCASLLIDTYLPNG